jgi:hypothetical protein
MINWKWFRPIALMLIGTIVILLALDWAASQDGENEDRDATASWLALRARDRAKIDSLQLAATMDSIEASDARRSGRRLKASADSAWAKIKIDSVAYASSGRDTVLGVTVRRPLIDTTSYWIPLFVVAAISESQRASDSLAFAVERDERYQQALRRLQWTLSQAIFARDSIIETRDARIRKLTQKKPLDYLAVGCVWGAGRACGIGLRYPFGR